MAASSLRNFRSFSLPSQKLPTKKTSTQLFFSSSSVPSGSSLSVSSSSFRLFPSGIYRHGLVPVVANDLSSSYSSNLLSVECPSLLYLNTLFCKSDNKEPKCNLRKPYNLKVLVAADEPEEALLRRFRKKVMKAGIIQESKRRRFFENKQDKKKRKTREAARRNRRRRPSSRTTPPEKKESSKKKKDEDEEEDNWALPEGDLPY
ncbi:30S ribosomal protein S21, chloroplastic-like [Macadamia integrifolia]|uniref:30S ribosomal protein S21, chloroplastic-like n=1 Tax=Macadamia integrifolia TaxID=60698 RepID=UPI001C4EBB09|nr:30S ribosomal protein S21, chloroplastic-like [Macadamia integrifolia]XP_042484888.1 30S ribosomal protein S21, chloroplastic-like [Macadamia integrifolia]